LRIISKHSDYYDGVMRSTGFDKSLTFVRDCSEEDYSFKIPDFSTKVVGKFEYRIHFGIVGFCGEIYPFVGVTKRIPHDLRYTPEEDICYSLDELVERFPKVVSKDTRYRFSTDLSHNNFKNWFSKCVLRRSYFDRTLEDKKPEIQKIFEKDKIAYFVVECVLRDVKYIKYPILNKYSFGRIYSAYEAFQKIEMYLSNELVKPDEINVVIDNDDKIQAHGFNEFSFRKEKES